MMKRERTRFTIDFVAVRILLFAFFMVRRCVSGVQVHLALYVAINDGFHLLHCAMRTFYFTLGQCTAFAKENAALIMQGPASYAAPFFIP